MDGIRIDYGASFLIGASHPTASPADLARSIIHEPAVRAALRGSRWRLLHMRPFYELDPDTGQHQSSGGELVLYDYTRNRTVLARRAGGAPVVVEPTEEQPVPSREEWNEAVELVRRSPIWAPALQSGVTPYRTMPPMLEGEPGEHVERTVYVGLVSKARRFNQVVAVNMLRGEVSRRGVQPRAARASADVCGLPAVDCNRPDRGYPGSTSIQWPVENPVWQFQVIRPAASSGTNGSGIELLDVRYRGTRVLKQAHMPILNVQYDGDACGPYRDWLWEETCFQADGQDVPGAAGFRWCDQPPQTILESRSDAGNFVGVAVYPTDDGGLGLVSQMSAGWYRYVLEWRFYQDGRILPRIRFGDTDNTCVCTTHNHHAYWRLDFDVVGSRNTVLENAKGVWQPLTKEVARVRQTGKELLWRVIEPKTSVGYDLIPGPNDGVGDAFSGNDQYALRWHVKEVDDLQRRVAKFGAEARLKPFVNKESIVNQDVVIWYAAHFRHAVDPDGEAPPVDIGPTLQPVNWPGA